MKTESDIHLRQRLYIARVRRVIQERQDKESVAAMHKSTQDSQAASSLSHATEKAANSRNLAVAEAEEIYQAAVETAKMNLEQVSRRVAEALAMSSNILAEVIKETEQKNLSLPTTLAKTDDITKETSLAAIKDSLILAQASLDSIKVMKKHRDASLSLPNTIITWAMGLSLLLVYFSYPVAKAGIVGVLLVLLSFLAGLPILIFLVWVLVVSLGAAYIYTPLQEWTWSSIRPYKIRMVLIYVISTLLGLAICIVSYFASSLFWISFRFLGLDF